MSIGLKLPHSCTYEHMIDLRSLSSFEILFLPKSFFWLFSNCKDKIKNHA